MIIYSIWLISILIILVDILKSRVYKSTNKMNNQTNNTADPNNNNNSNNNHHLTVSTVSSNSGATISRNSSDSSGGVTHTNSDLSADSGYHSRLCVDLNHDIDGENCSCTFFENNNPNSKFNKLKMLKNNSNLNRQTNNGCSNKSSFSSTTSSSSTTSTCGSSIAECNTPATTTMNNQNPPSIPRAHFESILKYILNDYVRLKNENDTLRKELDEKKITTTYKTIANINESNSELDTKNKKDVSFYY